MIQIKSKNSFKSPKSSFQENKTVSTLLIPNYLIEYLHCRVNENGSLAKYLKLLLTNCRVFTHSGMLPPPDKIKTEYQKEGLDLTKVNFRVDNDDWIELGELALAFGKSRCYLFSYLVELDLLGFWDALSNFNMNLGAPTHPKLSLKVSWKLNRAKYSFKRAYHVKI